MLHRESTITVRAGASLSRAVDQGLLNAALAGPEPEASHISVVENRSFRDQVRRALEAALVAGELKPGELYSAPVLGERFGVSATPVREAMLALAKDGFVVAERNRGFRVVELSDTDLDEVSQIRLLVEVPSTVEAAKVISDSELSRAAAIAQRIVDAAARGDLIDYLDTDRHFHNALISQLGNARLTELVDRLRRQTRLFGLGKLVETGRLVASAEEHNQLVETIRAHDTAATRRLITSHIKHVRGLWVGREEE
jgi:DNA-binding GntR family transcriptional regulator